MRQSTISEIRAALKDRKGMAEHTLESIQHDKAPGGLPGMIFNLPSFHEGLLKVARERVEAVNAAIEDWERADFAVRFAEPEHECRCKNAAPEEAAAEEKPAETAAEGDEAGRKFKPGDIVKDTKGHAWFVIRRCRVPQTLSDHSIGRCPGVSAFDKDGNFGMIPDEELMFMSENSVLINAIYRELAFEDR